MHLLAYLGFFTFLEAAETIERCGSVHEFVILQNSSSGFGDMSALWQLDSIRECQVVPNDATESQKTGCSRLP